MVDQVHSWQECPGAEIEIWLKTLSLLFCKVTAILRAVVTLHFSPAVCMQRARLIFQFLTAGESINILPTILTIPLSCCITHHILNLLE